MQQIEEELLLSIGYACITLAAPGTKLSSCQLKNASEERLEEIIHSNLQALEAQLNYNLTRGVGLFRISSDIIPFGSHPINNIPWWESFAPAIAKLGNMVKRSQMRVSMHPGQYTVLNAPDPSVVQAAQKDLAYHARFLDAMGLDHNHKIILHVGGVYANRSDAMSRFAQVYEQLPAEVKARLVIENDEKYAIDDVLELARSLDIPVVFDILHHQVCPPEGSAPVREWIEHCLLTWQSSDGPPKIHYSQQEPGMRPGAHSRTVRVREFTEFYRSLPEDLDIMLEVKDKNLSALKCIQVTKTDLPIKDLEEEWERYKYLVLEHSQIAYEEVQSLLKNQPRPDILQIYETIEDALHLPTDRDSELNAAQHVWDYFKKVADPKERAAFQRSIKQFENGRLTARALKNSLYKLAINYNISYLQHSYYFL